MHVYPAPGRTVRDPVTGLELTSKGVAVAAGDPFWLRRLAVGDVIENASVATAAADPFETAAPASDVPVAAMAAANGGKKK